MRLHTIVTDITLISFLLLSYILPPEASIFASYISVLLVSSNEFPIIFNRTDISKRFMVQS